MDKTIDTTEELPSEKPESFELTASELVQVVGGMKSPRDALPQGR